MAKSTRKAESAAPLSRQRKPVHLDAETWQRGLRAQFGREQDFTWRQLEGELPFGRFRVHNPQTAREYRVQICGQALGDNHCSCADFATNDLGTCKHIEFLLHRLRARRGAKTALARGWLAPVSEIRVQPGALRTLRFHAGAACPEALRQRAAALFDQADDCMAPERWAELDGFLKAARRLARRAGHELALQDEALTWLAQRRDTAQRSQRLAELYPKGRLGKLLHTKLYPYQAEGALFAARAGRALIADDMGLGKTVQAIAAAELLARHFGVRRVLVVCPTSLKQQWQREIARFARRQAQVLQGLRPQRQGQWAAEAFCKIVNYETLVRDLDQALDWAPELLIVDEAQRVKNWDTQAARALKRLAEPAQCPHVLVLTGTPLENRLEELISIVQVVDQHRLGPTWKLRQRHQVLDDTGRISGYRELDQLGATLAPIMLRRRKSEVLTQLPERVDKTLFVALTAEQRARHEENAAIVSRIVQRWRQTGYLSDLDQKRLQAALARMRMVCNSTWLLDHETDHGDKAGELLTLLDELFEQPDAKAVVFSQWLGTHEVLIKHLAARGWGHVFFHGSVPAEQRGALVDRFHQDPACRLFLSTDAGSTGLNLQHAAAVVVNMDLPWNPAVLEQRIGRVHRIGQGRSVQVINLVAEASIEERLLGLLAFKKSLFAGVLDGGASEVFMEGSSLTRFMKAVDEMTTDLAGDAAAPEPAEPEAAPAPAAEDEAPAVPGKTAAADPWAPLLDAGLQLLQTLSAGDAAGLVQVDEASGQRYLKLPLPEPAAVQRLASGLEALLKSLRR